MAQGPGNTGQTNPAPKLKPRSETFKQLQARMEQSILDQTNPAPLPAPKPKPRTKAVNQYDILQQVLDPVYQDQLKVPPPPPPKPKPSRKPDLTTNLDPDSLNEWWNTVSPWGHLLEELKDKKENEIIDIEADRIYKAVQLFNLLMTVNTTTLSNLINQLNLIADHLDKVSNKTKAAGIGGGATVVLGGLAAGAGILFAPLTLGASLAITAVGVGVATAGGVTGASAAIANKVNLERDKKNISKVFQDYNDIMQNLQRCLMFIVEGGNQLAQQALLSKANTGHVRLLRVVQLESICPKAIKANSEASGVMRGLAMGLDVYFKVEKEEKRKKLRSKLAMKLRVVAQELTTGLGEYVKANEDLREFRPVD